MTKLSNFRAAAFAVFVLSAPSQGDTNVQKQYIRRRTNAATRELQFGLNPFESSPAAPAKNSVLNKTERKGLLRGNLRKKITKLDGSSNNLKNFSKISKDRNSLFKIQSDEARKQQSSSIPASPSTKKKLSDSIIEDNAISGRVADNGKDKKKETTNRDRLGSPSREKPNVTGKSDTRDSDAGIPNKDDITSDRDDHKIGEPTRGSIRDNFVSNEDTSIDREDVSNQEATIDFINQKSKEDQKIGEPTRSTNRDDFLSNEENVIFARGAVSKEKVSGSDSDEAGRDDKRIGDATTNRENQNSNTIESKSDSDGGPVSASSLATEIVDETSKNDRKIGTVSTDRQNRISNIEDSTFLGV